MGVLRAHTQILIRSTQKFRPGHYAFLVSDAEFDAAFARIRARGVQYYADPRRAKPGEINHLQGGRGVYFDDPNGPRDGNNYPPLRRPARADLIVLAPATVRSSAYLARR